MPGPGPYGNKVPPNMKKIRRAAGQYSRAAAIHRKLSAGREKKPLPTGPPGFVSYSPGAGNFRQGVKRRTVAAVLDRKRKDPVPWQQEVRVVKKGTRLLREQIRDMRRPPERPSKLS